MQIRNSLFIVANSLWLYASLLSADVGICSITPGSRAKDITVLCPSGETKTAIHAETTINADDSMHLSFSATLFNNKRTIHIKDQANNTEVLTIRVLGPGLVNIQSLATKTWIFKGFTAAALQQLSIVTRGTLILEDAVETANKLEIETEKLYLSEPFSVKNGTFRLKYQQAFIARLNNAFNVSTDHDYAVIQSLTNSQSPSKRRTVLATIPHKESDIPLAHILSAYHKAFGQPLAELYPKYLEKNTDDERRAYLKSYVFSKISDNKKKGSLGEEIYQLYMAQNHPTFEFKDPKMGLNSFDAVHFAHEVKGSFRLLNEIIIAEVKYAKKGQPILGTKKIDDREWRQLSLPYVKSTLSEMLLFNEATKALAQSINNNSALVKLRLAVFNPDTFKLAIYEIGTMEKSLLD